MILYVCPKCGGNLICISTASIPPIISKQCLNCGWLSNPETDEITRIPCPENKTKIPEGCRTCSNHPNNGGNGICHCVLGITTKY